MRLIDADKIDFEKVFIGASDFAKNIREAAQELIDEQPTAYDVYKVIEQIENESKKYDEYAKPETAMKLYHRGVFAGCQFSMGIVRKGGVNE